MTEKPKFGVGSMDNADIEKKKEESTSENKDIEESADKNVHVEKSFGVGAKTEKTETSKNGLGEIFKTQGVSFWIISYVASFLIFMFLGSGRGLLDMMNLLLFPFTLILFSQLQVYLTGSLNGVARWLAPDFKSGANFDSGLLNIIWYVSKLVLYYFIWGFSYFLGIIGIASIVITANKANK
ncbi:hypothetical protein [Companilactobacillus sp. HBUAS59544]|uniref:hypothetical protein n=1 Tax=Companilactobacillus sp. HBUAS59544 TaxID=3109363 RepID=UPI002FEF4560